MSLQCYQSTSNDPHHLLIETQFAIFNFNSTERSLNHYLEKNESMYYSHFFAYFHCIKSFLNSQQII